jgi:hypothetical protein
MDIDHQSRSPSYKFLNDQCKTIGLHFRIINKSNFGNYAMYDGLVNGVDDIFKASITYCNKIIIWIMFQNFKIRTLTREKYNHYYNKNIESKWTPIEPIIKDIRVGMYHNNDSISNSTYNNKNHPLLSRIITI